MLISCCILQDIPFGSKERSLDLYKPEPGPQGQQTQGLSPVVVFIYGGTWGSGDKNMYGLLCSHLARHLQALVVCPNYSTYPRVNYITAKMEFYYCPR